MAADGLTAKNMIAYDLSAGCLMPSIVNRHYIGIINTVTLDNHLIQLNCYYTCNDYATIIFLNI